MKIFGVKIPEEPTLEEIEHLIIKIKKFQGNELEFNDIVKLCSLLDIVFDPKLNKGGSLMKFRSMDLVNVPGYTHGIFSVHVIHKGKSKRMVYKRNFPEILKHINKVIQIKRYKR
ncbi:hypothetical protein ACUNWD_10050 [Sunxiuqinia sp. A32]|uniref:hypothetical protein n=1 Tax=Sunxiuqinia sp. A32 TaxID=3461496 RepID=UPI004046383A